MTDEFIKKSKYEVLKLGIGGIVLAVALVVQRMDNKAEIAVVRKDNQELKTEVKDIRSQFNQYLLNRHDENVAVIEKNNEQIMKNNDFLATLNR